MDPAYIYSNDGVSGAEFRNRQGLLRLLGRWKGAGRPFTLLVISQGSRVGREQVETAYILKRIVDAAVRASYYTADQDRRLDGAMNLVSK